MASVGFILPKKEYFSLRSFHSLVLSIASTFHMWHYPHHSRETQQNSQTEEVSTSYQAQFSIFLPKDPHQWSQSTYPQIQSCYCHEQYHSFQWSDFWSHRQHPQHQRSHCCNDWVLIWLQKAHHTCDLLIQQVGSDFTQNLGLSFLIKWSNCPMPHQVLSGCWYWSGSPLEQFGIALRLSLCTTAGFFSFFSMAFLSDGRFYFAKIILRQS